MCCGRIWHCVTTCAFSQSRTFSKPQTEKPRKRVSRKRKHCNHSYCERAASKSLVERKFNGDRQCAEEVATAEGKPKGILKIRQKPPSEQRSVRYSRHALDRAKFREKYPSLNVIQKPGSKSDRSPLATSLDDLSSEWNAEQDEWARRKA